MSESILAYQIPDACNASGICRSKFYQLIKSGAIPIRKNGKRTLVLASDLKRFLEGLPATHPSAPLPPAA
jgi:hypothetical protein